MDQIRLTMMQHEALFKEQVRALHRLYNIQKSAMLEINKTCPQAQVLAFNSRGTTIVDDQFGGSGLEGRDWRSLCVSGQACKEASAAVSLHPICVLKEFKGSHSLYRDDIGLVAFHTQGKPIRNFDLEKLPEDWDESQIQIEPNNSGTLNEESMFCQRTVMTDDQASVIKAKLLTTEADPQSSKQIPGINCTMSLP